MKSRSLTNGCKGIIALKFESIFVYFLSTITKKIVKYWVYSLPTLAFASVAALRKELFPADGLPTHPISRSRVVLMLCSLCQTECCMCKSLVRRKKTERRRGR